MPTLAVNTSTPRKRAATSHPEHGLFVEFFDQLYSEHHDGARPTWGAKAGAMVKRLLAAHGLEECKRRALVLFEAAPAWMDGRDIQTLSVHFDKLAKPAEGKNGVGGLSADEIRGFAKFVEAQEVVVDEG